MNRAERYILERVFDHVDIDEAVIYEIKTGFRNIQINTLCENIVIKTDKFAIKGKRRYWTMYAGMGRTGDSCFIVYGNFRSRCHYETTPVG